MFVHHSVAGKRSVDRNALCGFPGISRISKARNTPSGYLLLGLGQRGYLRPGNRLTSRDPISAGADALWPTTRERGYHCSTVNVQFRFTNGYSYASLLCRGKCSDRYTLKVHCLEFFYARAIKRGGCVNLAKVRDCSRFLLQERFK